MPSKMENANARLFHSFFQRRRPRADVHRDHRHEGLDVVDGQADPEGVAGALRQPDPHRLHHQARQLLAKAADESREPKIQV